MVTNHTFCEPIVDPFPHSTMWLASPLATWARNSFEILKIMTRLPLFMTWAFRWGCGTVWGCIVNRFIRRKLKTSTFIGESWWMRANIAYARTCERCETAQTNGSRTQIDVFYSMIQYDVRTKLVYIYIYAQRSTMTWLIWMNFCVYICSTLCIEQFPLVVIWIRADDNDDDDAIVCTHCVWISSRHFRIGTLYESEGGMMWHIETTLYEASY